jgi:SNF2 family DNA or RNA helicase
LALPASDAATVWLDMSSDEKLLHDYALGESRKALRKVKQQSAHRSTMEQKLRHVREASGHIYDEVGILEKPGKPQHLGALKSKKKKKTHLYPEAFKRLHLKNDQKKKANDRDFRTNPAQCTKLKALLNDLADLKKVESKFHAVVFTSSNASHQMIVRMIQPLYAVCEFRTGDDPKKRDKAIRTFQAGLKGGASAKATVFVVTMKAGAVGITLTAATRCYLMEPCLDVSPRGESQIKFPVLLSFHALINAFLAR